MSADDESVQKTILFRATGDTPSGATRTVSFTCNDGDADSTGGTRDLTVVPVDDAPTVSTSGGSASYSENAAGSTVDFAVTGVHACALPIEGATVQVTTNRDSSTDVLDFAGQNGITGSWT